MSTEWLTRGCFNPIPALGSDNMHSRAALVMHCRGPMPPHLAPRLLVSCRGASSSSSAVSGSVPFTSCGPPAAGLLPLLSGYGACVTFPIHWGDMDKFGHCNNVQFVRYIESGRVAALLAMAQQRVDGVAQAELQRALSSFMTGRGIGVILKSVSVKYKRPLTYPDVVAVGSALTRLSADRFTLSHVVVSSSQQAVVAEGEGTLVCFDYSTGDKAPLPSLVHTAIAQWGATYAGRTDEEASGTGTGNLKPHAPS